MFDRDGVYHLEVDVRGAFIRAKMREKYPRIEDEFAVAVYGTAEEKAAHAAWRDEVKREADRRFPKECARAVSARRSEGATQKTLRPQARASEQPPQGGSWRVAGGDEVGAAFLGATEQRRGEGDVRGVTEEVSSDAEQV